MLRGVALAPVSFYFAPLSIVSPRMLHPWALEDPSEVTEVSKDLPVARVVTEGTTGQSIRPPLLLLAWTQAEKLLTYPQTDICI